MANVTDHTRNEIWQDFTDAERYLRYYTSLADKYRTRHHRVRSALLGFILFEAIVVVPLWTTIEAPWGTIFIVLVASIIIALTVFDATSNDAKNSALLNVASDECAHLHTEWRFLWADIETDAVEERQVRERQRVLLDRMNLIAARTELKEDEKRNIRYAEEANEVMKGRYVASS